MSNLLLYTIIFSLAVFFITTIRMYFIWKSILKLVKSIDKEKEKELTTIKLPLINSFMWVNPVKFEAFLKTPSFKGNTELEQKIKACKNTALFGRMMFVLFGICLVLAIVTIYQ